MFHNIAAGITCRLIRNKMITVKNRDSYIRGLEEILLNEGLMTMFFLISLLTKEMGNFWMYFVIFFPLRIFSGGYHVEKSEKRFILSIIMYTLSIVIIKMQPLLYQDRRCQIAGVISVLAILALSPLISNNNPVKQLDRNKSRIIVSVLLIIDIAFFILSCSFEWKIASSELIYIVITAMLLGIEKIDRYFSNEDKQLKNKKEEKV